MKLRTKLMMFFIMALTVAMGLSGFITLYIAKAGSVKTAASSYQNQLNSAALAFEQITYRQDLTSMNDIVRRSYLQFEFRESCGEGYVLMQNDEILINLTDYDIVNPDLIQRDYHIQRVDGREMLLTKRDLKFPENAAVISIQDISDIYDGYQQQMVLFLVVYLVSVTVVGGLVALSVKKLLKPFEELKTAAGELSNGKLESRAVIHTQDEIGELGLAFNHMADKIQQQVEDLKLLMGSLTHEIKTPMTAIIGYAYSLLHVELPEQEQKLALEYIYREGKRLDLLSAKMMNLLGYYENNAIERQWLDVSELFRSVTALEAGYLKEHQASLSAETISGMRIYGDRILLESLLSNLIHNAVKASSGEAVIILRATAEGLAVKDFGCGIPSEEIANVTKAFYMVNKSRSKKAGGAGLGLAICQQIVSLHEARLEIESQINKGTQVSVTFPDVYKSFTSH